jgi:hypothetical protein
MKLRTLWRREVNHIAIALEHVDLLNCLDGLHIELLERRLQLLVVGAGGLVDLLDLSSRRALATTKISISNHCPLMYSCPLCVAGYQSAGRPSVCATDGY